MTDISRRQPSLWYAALGLPFLLAGGGFFAYTLFHELTHVTDSLTQVVVPGRAEMDLTHGRTYTVFSEERSVVNGRIYSTTESISGLECRIRSLRNGTVSPMWQARMNTTYDIGGRSGRSVLQFSVPESGKYEFTCAYETSSRGPVTVLAVGAGVAENLFYTIATSLAALFAGMGLSLAVVLTVVIRRYRYGKARPIPHGT